MLTLLENREANGAFNFTAPEPVTNWNFARVWAGFCGGLAGFLFQLLPCDSLG